jgi:transcriptional regulator with XRE-family HTH domain
MKYIYSLEQKKIVAKLVKARLDLHLTQAEVAERLDKTQSYISKLEAGQRQIDVVELKLLSTIYKKKINYFL